MLAAVVGRRGGEAGGQRRGAGAGGQRVGHLPPWRDHGEPRQPGQNAFATGVAPGRRQRAPDIVPYGPSRPRTARSPSRSDRNVSGRDCAPRSASRARNGSAVRDQWRSCREPGRPRPAPRRAISASTRTPTGSMLLPRPRSPAGHQRRPRRVRLAEAAALGMTLTQEHPAWGTIRRSASVRPVGDAGRRSGTPPPSSASTPTSPGEPRLRARRDSGLHARGWSDAHGRRGHAGRSPHRSGLPGRGSRRRHQPRKCKRQVRSTRSR